MNTVVNESLDYHDFKNQIEPVITIDEYEAKTGSDDEIVTIAFTVKGKLASQDLANWFERGYDYVLDAQISKGEVIRGKHLVFVEMERRFKVPERIIELIEDLETLTDIPLAKWTIIINDQEVDANIDILSSLIIKSPHEYRKQKDSELNEMRELSGNEPNKLFNEQDEAIKSFKALAGL
jgi:hypothetical protein